MERKVIKMFAFGLVSVLFLSGMLNTAYADPAVGKVEPAPGKEWNDFTVYWTAPIGEDGSFVKGAAVNHDTGDKAYVAGYGIRADGRYYVRWVWKETQDQDTGVTWWMSTQNNENVAIGKREYTLNADVVRVIPEFTTIALPVAAILGLLFIFSRRRGE